MAAVERFAQRYGQHGLDEAMNQELGLSFSTDSTGVKREDRPSRSASPRRFGNNKRPPSPEPRAAYERPGSIDRSTYGAPPPGNDHKRLRPNHPPEMSPAPSSVGGGGGWGRRQDMDDDFESRRRRPVERVEREREREERPPRPVPYALNARGDQSAILPDGLVFFMSILPSVSSFNGTPILLLLSFFLCIS